MGQLQMGDPPHSAKVIAGSQARAEASKLVADELFFRTALLLSDDGHSVREIARLTGRSKSAVDRALDPAAAARLAARRALVDDAEYEAARAAAAVQEQTG